MTQHSSLKGGRKGKRHRSVLKRFERIKILEDKKEWTENNSIFGLPKVKTVRIRIKKEKAASEAAPGTATPTAPTAAAPTAPGKAPAAPGKPPVAPKEKEAAKKETPKKEK